MIWLQPLCEKPSSCGKSSVGKHIGHSWFSTYGSGMNPHWALGWRAAAANQWMLGAAQWMSLRVMMHENTPVGGGKEITKRSSPKNSTKTQSGRLYFCNFWKYYFCVDSKHFFPLWPSFKQKVKCRLLYTIRLTLRQRQSHVWFLSYSFCPTLTKCSNLHVIIFWYPRVIGSRTPYHMDTKIQGCSIPLY